jgi:hypothetical protein
MSHLMRTAVLFVSTAVSIAAAKEPLTPAPAADAKTIELIHELALPESPTALRDQPNWRAPKRIVMATGNPNGTSASQQLDALKAVAPGVELVAVANADELAKQVGTADAIIGGDDTVCDARVLAAAGKQLRWVAIMSAGVEGCLGKPALERPGLTTTNMRAVAGPVMAEHTIALMFALSRSLQVSHSTARRCWSSG